MAYSDVPAVAVGDLYTAADFNTYLRDNFASGIPDKFTAKGDLGIGEGADTIIAVAVGNNDEWLMCDTDAAQEVAWGVPTGFWEWFTFGDFSHVNWTNKVLNAGGDTLLYLPDLGVPSTAGLFLASLSVQRNTDGFIAWSVYDQVHVGNLTDTANYILTRAIGTSTDTTTWDWNTQTGLIFVDTSDSSIVDISWPVNIGLTMTIKIWGYA